MIAIAEEIGGETLSEDDIRRMVRLASEVATMPTDHIARKRHLMTGLCELIGASSWAWALGRQIEPDKQPVYAAFEHGGFDQERFTHYLNALEHPDMARLNATIARELAEQQSHVTRRREEIDPDNRFPSSGAYTHWRQADLGPVILSLRPLGDASVSGVGLYRRHESPAFTVRESRIAHIVLSEVPWLHELGWPEDRGATIPKLYPRQRVVLNLLLQGYGRQSISEHMKISVNTVSGYVKGVYRHFGVRSHASLIRRFRLVNTETQS